MNRKALANVRKAADNNLVLLDEALVASHEFTQLVAELYADASGKFKSGKLITGRVVSKSSDGVLVNIDYKSDGLLANSEFSDFELEKIHVDDQIEVLIDQVEDVDGNVVLSYQKAKSLKAWDRLAELAAADEPVKGIVTHKVKGGLSVDVGIPAFLPGSQVDTARVNNFDQFIGEEVFCKIIKINKRRGNVIVSRRKYLESLRSEEKKSALEILTEGQVIEGVVKNITNYGAFVDVGGIDGLLHITDISWGRIGHPSEVLKVGDKINVKVLSFDKEHEKISLGMKQLASNPWDDIEGMYPVGAVLEGAISNIADYGLFVEVAKGVEGLVHISEVSWTERIHNLQKHFQIGNKIKVMVLAIDKEGGRMRMRLSIKRLDEDPWAVVFNKFTIGDVVEGAITNITDFGIFVQLHDGVDGLVHISDISWTDHVIHPSDRYKKADVLKVVILGIDKDNKRISLGIKQLDRDPWERIEEEFPIGKVVKGTVSKVTSFGAFIRFNSGVEGLVHISEITNKDVDSVEGLINVGSEYEFKVVRANKAERKLGLSLRAVTEPEETAKSSVRESSNRNQGGEHYGSSAAVKSDRSERPFERNNERSYDRGGDRSSNDRSSDRSSSDRSDRYDKRSNQDSGSRSNRSEQGSSSSSSMRGSLQQALEDHMRDDKK
jgi:small subunit ribosomal protein S1